MIIANPNPVERKRIETEQEAWRTVNAMFEDKERELMKKIKEKDKALDEKDKALDEKDKLIAELMQKLNRKK